MLRPRIVTAVLAGALIVAAILTLPAAALAALAAGVTLVGAWEWSSLAGVQHYAGRAAYLAVLALAATGCWLIGPTAAIGWLALAVACWIAVCAWLLVGARPRAGGGTPRWGWLVAGLLLLPPLALGLSLLATRVDWAGRGLLLYVVCLVWAADTGAYFAGRAWGRHKLAPDISAGKTREGVGGGVAAVAVYAAIGGALLAVPGADLGAWIGLAVVAGLVSVAGDLLESLLKREAGVKDSGTLLPGHGGLLDRIDSLIASTPVMVAGLLALGAATVP